MNNQQQHPITPPPELVRAWIQTDGDECFDEFYKRITTQAAQWGADQELEACCEWVSQFNYDDYNYGDGLRTARRPKPPSLKEQALALLDDASDRLDAVHENTIRRALEQLDD